jgi:hypothetical protein
LQEIIVRLGLFLILEVGLGGANAFFLLGEDFFLGGNTRGSSSKERLRALVDIDVSKKLVLHVVNEFFILGLSHWWEFLRVTHVPTQGEVLLQDLRELVLRVVDITRHRVNSLIVKDLIIIASLIEFSLLENKSLNFRNSNIIKKLISLWVAE